MAGRALPSSCLIVLLAAGSTAAQADTEGIAVGEPSPNQQQQAEAPRQLPKLLGFGKGEDGTHAFLFARQDGPPVVFVGKPGDLKEHEVLNMERGRGEFIVDTLELGDIRFNTVDKSVIFPGEVGFNTKKPTRVLRGTPDQAAFVEAMARMGYARRTPTPVQAAVQNALGRVLTRTGKAVSTTSLNSRQGMVNQMTANARTSKRVRSVKRPVARLRTNARGGRSSTTRTTRATARAAAH